ncbi:DinB family protein [Mucilaginibacter gotjawali]|uniref:Damage-inducible protein DinB n=1 Tax=Mucilaginibacter gotjawali TaxID=1550579 RepID=A0A839SAX3_9SPHI|nr:DinB family protein [Mucilaginibacter gotjawali]MBB3054514.1 putative damage-inducible protein DinB [Mucilaginibacter gotjawali]
MEISTQLSNDLTEVLQGNPWYGPSVYEIIEQVSFEAAFEKPPGSVHSIAGILLHMISWTEEVIDRMNGLPSQVPSSGDWPDPGTPDEQKWQNYVSDLKLVNVNLLGIIQNFPKEQWTEHVTGVVENDPGTTFEALIKGLIQHHIYHSGQVSLLLRIID